jgi:hypothetical protein
MSRFVSVVVAFLFVCSFSVVSAQEGPIGSFNVGDGPIWTSNPPTYSCLDACAMLFGGSAENYFCSTSAESIDNQAYVDGWGDTQYCDSPVAEDFKLNDFYDCGSTSCAFSAYVEDHGACETSVNYCYASGVEAAAPVPVMNRTGMLVLSVLILLVAGFGIQRVRHNH